MSSHIKKIFIAATRQNDGKTTISLGLIHAFKETLKNIGFIKPIGQRYLVEEGCKVDEDSVLIEQALQIHGLECTLKDMSPIAVERGFTEEYILKPRPENLDHMIRDSFSRVARGRDMVVIEGTGHAGVGSVFDHSNAMVAKLLEAPVIIIASGGIGRPIDEIVLNYALFQQEGVRVLGAIVNKVLAEKFERVARLVRLGLERKGIKVLGVIPYDPDLSCPTVERVLEEIEFELITGKKFLQNKVKKIIVGAMEPHEALDYIGDGCLVITPGDREDIIMTALALHLAEGIRIAGLILTGGLVPHTLVKRIMEKANIPVLLSKSDTYTVASEIHDMNIKIRPTDEEKIEKVRQMAKKYIDIKGILSALKQGEA